MGVVKKGRGFVAPARPTHLLRPLPRLVLLPPPQRPVALQAHVFGSPPPKMTRQQAPHLWGPGPRHVFIRLRRRFRMVSVRALRCPGAARPAHRAVRQPQPHPGAAEARILPAQLVPEGAWHTGPGGLR